MLPERFEPLTTLPVRRRASNLLAACITLEIWTVPSRSMIAPCGLLLILARVALDHLHAFDDHALLLGQDLDDLAALAAFGAGRSPPPLALFHMKFRA